MGATVRKAPDMDLPHFRAAFVQEMVDKLWIICAEAV
jgi:hypothetical protein